MKARTRIATAAGIVTLLGAAVLSTPAKASAAVSGCSWDEWDAALAYAGRMCKNSSGYSVSNCSSSGGTVSFKYSCYAS
jgi:hypothetical protein